MGHPVAARHAPRRRVQRWGEAALAAAGMLAACGGADPVPAGGDTPPPSAAPPTLPTDPNAAPPVASPDVWLDARKIPLGTTTLRTWADSSPHHADATSVTALSFSPTGLDGRPGVVFAGSYFQAVSIQAAKVPAFRASPGAGFAVFIVAAEKAVANTRAESVLFERFQAVGRFPAVRRVGLQLTRSNALGEVIAALSSYEGQQLTTEAKVRIPSLGAPHLYVVHGEGGSVTLRVDGFIARTASGFVENDFATNGDLPLTLGAHRSARATDPETDLRLTGLVGLFAVYTRPLSVAEVAAGEAATKAAWGIP